MTVRELIELLEQYDDDMVVVYPVFMINPALHELGYYTMEAVTDVGVNENGQMELC